ncbi:MAG: hypothetical protein ACLR5G_01365 [Eubacteriales bacterium]
MSCGTGASGASVRLSSYVRSECRFCSTLVDRIVSGKPSPEDEFGSAV